MRDSFAMMRSVVHRRTPSTLHRSSDGSSSPVIHVAFFFLDWHEYMPFIQVPSLRQLSTGNWNLSRNRKCILAEKLQVVIPAQAGIHGLFFPMIYVHGSPPARE
jgi:hypothetical protein